MKYKVWIGFALSVVLAGLVLRQVELPALIASLTKANVLLLLPAALAMLSTLLIRSWRWKYLMEAIKPIRIMPLLSATTIGAMTDMVLPGRGGDLVRASLVGHNQEVSTAATLATLLVEKMLDVVMVVLVAIPVLALVTFPGEMHEVIHAVRLLVFVLAAACGGVIAVLIVLALRDDAVRKVGAMRLPFLPKRWQGKAAQWTGNFAIGLRTIRNGHHVFAVLLLSVCLWSAFALSNFLVLEAFGLQLPVYASFLFLVFQVLGVTLPSSPGFIGTYHAAVIAGFALFPVARETAVSVAITMHAVFFFPFVTAGFLFLWSGKLTLRTVRALEA